MPVYVYDLYPGYQVKEFTELTTGELEFYLECNYKALQSVFEKNPPQLAISQHTIMQPVYTTLAISDLPETRHLITIHGSALNFSVRKSNLLQGYARQGIKKAHGLVFLSKHSMEEFSAFFPALTRLREGYRIIPAGVDTEIFKPLEYTGEKQQRIRNLVGQLKEKIHSKGCGRTQSHQKSFHDNLRQMSEAKEISGLICDYRSKANNWLPDEDAGAKLSRLDWNRRQVILYYGKYLWTKGVQLLIAAAPLILMKHPQARFVLVGFGESREFLEAMVGALDQGRIELFKQMLEAPLSFDPEGAGECFYTGGILDYLSDPGNAQAYKEVARGHLRERVIFTGIMDHNDLRQLIPCTEFTAAPSIFPEAFGLVAIEALASGVLPVQTYHTGFADVAKVYREEFADIYEHLKLSPLLLNDMLVPNLAHHLNRLTEYFAQLSENERQEIRKRAHMLAKSKFSWTTVAQKYLE